jgi:hypothetical protein
VLSNAPLQYVLRLELAATLYLLTGKLGLWMPFTSGNVSPVWPAAGVALAAVMFWVSRVWLAIVLGAFILLRAGSADHGDSNYM